MNEKEAASKSASLDDMVYVGITRPSILRGEREYGDDLHYYHKFMPAYRRFAKTLQRESGTYGRLSEVEESLDDRLSELQQTIEWASYSFRVHNDLSRVVDSVESISSLLDDGVFEYSIWDLVDRNVSDPPPDEEEPFLEIRRGVPPYDENEFVVHTGGSNWRVSAEIESLDDGIQTRMSMAATHQQKSIERHGRAQAAFDAVQEVLFEYETGRQIGRLMEDEERIDHGEEKKKRGPNKRISDQEIVDQINQVADMDDFVAGDIDPTPLSKDLEEVGELGQRQYFNRITDIKEKRD